MDYLGYEKELVLYYIEGLLSNDGEDALLNELISMHNIEKELCQKLNEELVSGCVVKSRCRWYLRQGAQADEKVIASLKVFQKRIYNDLFVCDV